MGGAPQAAPAPAAVVQSSEASLNGQPPAVPPEIPQYYLPVRGRAPAGCTLLYRPNILGAARVAFTEAKSRFNQVQALQFLTEVSDDVLPVDWERAAALETAISDLEKRPDEVPANAARFGNLPGPASKVKNYTAWTRDFTTWLYGTQGIELFYSPSQKLYSQAGEAERDFRVRLGQGAREQRDEATEALRKKYAPRIATLKERLRKAEQAVAREKEQARQAGLQTAISIGATLLGAFTGRKTSIKSNVGRATTAARGVGRSVGQSQDVGRAEDTVEAVQKQLEALTAEFEEEAANLAARIDPASEAINTLAVKPKKADINVQLLALTWAPYWQDENGTIEPAW
jgi:hypothetical protein